MWWMFSLFKSNFLRNRSLRNSRWYFFSLKSSIIGKGNRYLTKNWFGRNEKITVIWIICVQRNSQIQTSIELLLAKHRFLRNCPTYYICFLLLPYQCKSSSMRGILLTNFDSYEPVKTHKRPVWHTLWGLLLFRKAFILHAFIRGH